MDAQSKNEVLTPHAIRFETDAVYKARANRNRTRRESMLNTVAFQVVYPHQTINCIVGQEVITSANVGRLTGAEKYVKGYFDVLLLSQLLQIAPDGHPNIMVSIAHPPDATDQHETILNVIGGKHTIVRLDGKTVEYRVKAVIPFDEPSGGLTRAMTHEHHAYNPFEIDPGDKVGILDVGGKIGSVTPVLMTTKTETHTLWKDGHTFYFGIQDVIRELNSALRSMHPEIFKKDVPMSILEDILQNDGHTKIQGRPADFREALGLAVSPLTRELNRIYVEEMGRALDIKHFYITGGGGGLLENIIRTQVLNHSCSLVDYAAYIQLANMRGGMYAFEQYVRENVDRDLRKLFAHSVAPLLVCCDLGNSWLKSGVIYVS